MKITKLGHCCLLIETKGKRILTDPGSYTIEKHSQLNNIDYVLFTHEHGDHYHLDSLKVIIKNNPQVKIYSNNSVNDLLNKEGVDNTKISDGESIMLDKVSIKGIGEKHAVLHSSIPTPNNIGLFIDERLWYPGDAFTNPKIPVEIMALPVSAPWLKISESIDYALLIKPKKAFPVHDGTRFTSSHVLPSKILPANNIEFILMVEGDIKEF